MQRTMPLIKIKFDLGFGEIVNCCAEVYKYKYKDSDYYHLYFDDGISHDSHCKFDSARRVFYGAD